MAFRIVTTLLHDAGQTVIEAEAKTKEEVKDILQHLHSLFTKTAAAPIVSGGTQAQSTEKKAEKPAVQAKAQLTAGQAVDAYKEQAKQEPKAEAGNAGAG